MSALVIVALAALAVSGALAAWVAMLRRELADRDAISSARWDQEEARILAEPDPPPATTREAVAAIVEDAAIEAERVLGDASCPLRRPDRNPSA